MPLVFQSPVTEQIFVTSMSEVLLSRMIMYHALRDLWSCSKADAAMHIALSPVRRAKCTVNLPVTAAPPYTDRYLFVGSVFLPCTDVEGTGPDSYFQSIIATVNPPTTSTAA
jgi:hypothetical protein